LAVSTAALPTALPASPAVLTTALPASAAVSTAFSAASPTLEAKPLATLPIPPNREAIEPSRL